MSSQSENLGKTENSRTAAQFEHMKNTVEKGKCPFCEIDRKVNPVDLYLGTHWRMWENAWPYPHQTHHIVIPTIKHLTSLSELNEEILLELSDMVHHAFHAYELRSGVLVLRFGDQVHNAGTLSHLHLQIQVPNKLGPVFVTMGKPDQSQQEEVIKQLLTKPPSTPQLRIEDVSEERLSWTASRSLPPHVSHLFSFTPELRRRRDFFVSLFLQAQELERIHSLPGGTIMIGFKDFIDHVPPQEFDNAYLVVATGTGPVLRVIHPALNRGQAEKCIPFLLRK